MNKTTKNEGKIIEIKSQISEVKRNMKSGNKNLFTEFVKLQNKLDKLMIKNLSEDEQNLLETIAKRHGRNIDF
jgi:uncharacterized iron-regulated protein